jgi:hypothetical protein
MNYIQIEHSQKETCFQNECSYVCAPEEAITGFAGSTEGMIPINGLRHHPTQGTTGWYIWCGDTWSERADFFQPLHTKHLYEKYELIAHLLGLPPGFRFLQAGDYLDIWFDPSLLNA